MIGSTKNHHHEEPAAPARKSRASAAKKPAKTGAEEPEKRPDPLMMKNEPESPEQEEDEGQEIDPQPAKKVPAPASLVTTPSSGKPAGFSGGFDRKKIAAVLILLLIIAGAALSFSGHFSLPRFSSATGFAAPTVPVTGTPVIEVTATATRAPVATTNSAEATTENISLVPGPTRTPTDNLAITLQAERDPQTKMVSVQYMGGKGQMGVREIFVRLTRSDGQVLTGSFKPVQVGSGVELQGTEQVDRLVVIVRYYTGDEYTVIDKIFEYKIRSG